jgi:hypothetical protein
MWLGSDGLPSTTVQNDVDERAYAQQEAVSSARLRLEDLPTAAPVSNAGTPPTFERSSP